MSIIQGTAKASGDASFYPFEISSSLRFDGSSYLSRNMNGFSTTTYTLSMWIKRSKLGAIKIMGKADNPYVWHEFKSSDKYGITDSGSGIPSSVYYESNNVLRDTSAWYHFVTVYNISSSLDVKFYINGTLASTSSLSGVYGNGSRLAGNYDTYIGRDRSAGVSGQNFEGYMAEINFLDGYVPTTSNGGIDSSGNLQVLGETKNGVWIPKNPSGLTYGTNGFRLSFALSDFNTSGSAVTDPHGSSTNVPDGYVADASGSGNHWNVN